MTQQRKKIIFLFLSLILAFSCFYGFASAQTWPPITANKAAIGNIATIDELTLQNFDFVYTLSVPGGTQINRIVDNDSDDRLALERIKVGAYFVDKIQSITATPVGGGADVSLPWSVTSTPSTTDVWVGSASSPIDSGAGTGTARVYQSYTIRFKSGTVGPADKAQKIWLYFKMSDPANPYAGHTMNTDNNCAIPHCNWQTEKRKPNCTMPLAQFNQKANIAKNIVCNWAEYYPNSGTSDSTRTHDNFRLSEPTPVFEFQKASDKTNVEIGSLVSAAFRFGFDRNKTTSQTEFNSMRFVAILPANYTFLSARVTDPIVEGKKVGPATVTTLSGGRTKVTFDFNSFKRADLDPGTSDFSFVLDFIPTAGAQDSKIYGYWLVDNYSRVSEQNGFFKLINDATPTITYATSAGKFRNYINDHGGNNAKRLGDELDVKLKTPTVRDFSVEDSFSPTTIESLKTVNSGDAYSYRVTLKNTTATPANYAVIYEALPQGNEPNSFKPKLNGPVVDPGDGVWVAQYCVHGSPCENDPNSPTGWKSHAEIGGAWGTVAAYKITLRTAQTIPAGGAEFTIPMTTAGQNARSYEIANHNIYIQKEVNAPYIKAPIAPLTAAINPRVKVIYRWFRDDPAVPALTPLTITYTPNDTSFASTATQSLATPPGQNEGHSGIRTLLGYGQRGSNLIPIGWKITAEDNVTYSNKTHQGVCSFTKETARNSTDPKYDYECTFEYRIPSSGTIVKVTGTKNWDPKVRNFRDGMQFELQFRKGATGTFAAVDASMMTIATGCSTANPMMLTDGSGDMDGNDDQVSFTWCVPKGPDNNPANDYEYRLVEKGTAAAFDLWTQTGVNGTSGTNEFAVPVTITNELDGLKGRASITNTYRIPDYTAADPFSTIVTWINGPEAKPDAYLTLRRFKSKDSIGCNAVVDQVEEVPGFTPIKISDLTGFTKTVGTYETTWAKTFDLSGFPKQDAYGCAYVYWIEATKSDGTELDADFAYAITDGDSGTNENSLDKITLRYRTGLVTVTGTKKWVGGTSLTRPDINLGIYVKSADGTKLMVPDKDPRLGSQVYFDSCGTDTYQGRGVVRITNDSDPANNMTDVVKWCVPAKDRDGQDVTYYIDESIGDEYSGAANPGLPSGIETLGQKPANYTKSFENATTVVNTYTPPTTNAGGDPADDGKVIATVVWRCGTTVCPATVAKSDLTLELHRQWKSANGPCGGTITCGAMDEGLTLANKTVALANADAATHGWKATWPTGGEAASLPNADPATGMTYYYTATPTGFDPNVWEFVSVENPVNGNAAPVLTFRYRVQNVEVQAKKVWVNGENSAEKNAALGNIRFTLQRRIKGIPGAWQSAILINEPGYVTTNGSLIPADPNGGEVKWKTPKTNANGQEYEFNVIETPGTIPGFEVGVVAQPNPNELKFTVTNKYDPPVGDITLTKQWANGVNYPAQSGTTVTAKFTLQRSTDGVNFETVTITTPSAGYAVSPDAELNQPGTSLKWETALKDQTGKPYTFKVVETTPANFTSEEIQNANSYQFEFKNTFVPPISEKVGTKVWNGGSELPRPAVTLTLQRKATGDPDYSDVPAAELKNLDANCKMENPVTINAAPWTVRWCAEDYDQTGLKYAYRIKEAPVAGYTATQTDAMTVTNEFKVDNTVTFTGTVAWIGGSGHRPANVSLELKRVQVDNANADIPGTEEAGFTPDKPANQASTWKATWNGLANKNQGSGRNYRYYVDTSWTDPDFDKVKSLADQTVLGGPNTTDTVTFKYKGGGSLVGVKRWDGGWEDARFDVTLTLMRKGNGPFASWEHAVFTAGSPETAVVTLQKVDAGTHLWQKEWSDVITTDGNGLPYQFRIEEDVVPAGAYFEEIDDGNPMMVTNKFKAPPYDDGDPATPDGTYVGKKFWLPDNSVASPKIEMQLYRQAYNPTVAAGVAVGSPEPVGAAVDVTAADNWEHAFTNLVKYQETTGYEYKYWVDEVSVPAGFVKVVDAGNTTPQLENYDNTIYNKKDELPNTVTLTKTWLNVPGGYTNNCVVSFSLLNDGVLIDRKKDGTPLAPGVNPQSTTGTAQTTFRWEDMPDQSGAGYSIVETLGANCGSFTAGAVNPTSPEKTSFTATNTYNSVPIPQIKATKIWKNGQTKRTPVNFTLHRSAGVLDEVVPDAELAGGMGTCKTTATVTLTPTGTFPTSSAIEKQSATWCNLKRETDAGTPFVYYVTEAFVNPADAALWDASPLTGDPTNVAGDGMSITNTFKPSKTSIVIHKEWTRAITTDNVTVDVRKRVTSGVDAPESIGPQTLTQRDHADPGNPKIWTLPAIEVDAVNEKGQPLSYSIAETQLAGCNVPTYVGQDTNDITVKNDCDYQKATIQATVNWVGVTPVGTAPAVTLTFTNDKGLPSQTLSYPAGSDPSLMQSIQVDAVVLVGGAEQPVTWQVKQTFDIPAQADDYNTTVAAIQNVPPLTLGGTVTVDFTNTRKHEFDKVTVQKEWVGGPANKPGTWLKLQRSTDNGLTKNDVPGAPIKEVAAGTAATVTVEWDNIEQKDPVTSTYFKFYAVETDNAGADATVDGYDKDETAERKVTNTWNGKPISITAEKEWTDSDPHPQIWFKLLRSIDGGTTKEDAGVPDMMVPAAAPFTVTWNNVPSADATGRDYTFYVREVDNTGNDFTPAGYGKVESGLKVVNSKSGMLTVDLTTDPYTPMPFEINVTNGGTLNYTEQIDNDAADLTRDNIVNVNNILPQPHTVKINGLDTSIWTVRAITCTERALGSASGTGVDLAITREQNGGELTGKFVIDNMPATSIVECHYDLQSRVGGQVFVSNETADNPPNPLPVYTYETTGSGYVGFNVPANGAPDNQGLLPGTYTVAQQNINGWVTMDVVVESSDPNRNPLISWTERPATIAVPNGTGFESAVTFKVEPNDRVTVKFINGPANSVFIREINIPASSTQQFMIHGFANGVISPTKSILKSGLIPNGNRWQLTQGQVDDWELVDITCTERGTVGPLSTLVDIPNRTVHIGLDQGEAITCIFTNRSNVEPEEHYDPPIPGFTDLDVLPRTGFAPGRITNLIDQPAMKRYDTSPLRLTIPSMDVSLEVFGVPRTDGYWDVTWLGKNAGYIEGSAYPMQEGNSIITAHVWDEYNNPGPFFGLKDLKYGDRFMLTAYGKTYIYEVRESERIAETEVDQLMTPKESGIWTTLMTCEAYDEGTARYDYRRFVRAVLIEIQ